jgi:predicted ATPase
VILTPNVSGCSRLSVMRSAVIAQTDAVVLVLDDIHWADKPSLLLLRYLLRRGRTDPATDPRHLS